MTCARGSDARIDRDPPGATLVISRENRGCLDGCFCSDAHCRNVATEGGRPTVRARLVRFAGIAVILVVLFAGLYFAIVSFE